MNQSHVKAENTESPFSPPSKGRLEFTHEQAGIEIRSLGFEYNHDPIFQRFSAFIPQGKMTCIIGANGAGKTTLLKLIAQILKPQQGQINFLGFPQRQPTISYFRQFHDLDRHFPLKVMDIIGLSHADLSPWRLSFHPAHHENCLKNLERLGIQDLKDHFLSELSQGQIQKVYLARFLAEESEILLLDEPFNFIDHQTQTEMLSILRTLKAAGKTIVAIIHQNPELAIPFDHQISLGSKS